MRGHSVRLGDVAEFIRGINFKPNDVVPVGSKGTVACLRTKNVQADLDLSDVWAVDESFVRRTNQILQRGDLLVSSANSWNLVGKCCWIPELPWKATFGGFVSVVRPDRDKIDPRFLYLWFASERTQTLLRSFGQKTTNISNLNAERTLNLSVWLPPLPEQRRIAEVLDRAEALRTKRRSSLRCLETLSQAIFVNIFGDPVTNSKKWPDRATLGEVAEIASGITKGRGVKGKATREVPYLAVVNVQDRALDLSTIKWIPATEEEIRRFRLEPNDLLLTEGGDPDKLGRGTLWAGEVPECIHQNHIFRVRLTDNRVAPVFLNWLVGGQRGKRYFLRSAKQTTGIASVNMTQLRNFPLLIPPLHVQLEFTRCVTAVERIKAAHRASLAELDALFASLQHRAFRGEL